MKKIMYPEFEQFCPKCDLNIRYARECKFCNISYIIGASFRMIVGIYNIHVNNSVSRTFLLVGNYDYKLLCNFAIDPKTITEEKIKTLITFS